MNVNMNAIVGTSVQGYLKKVVVDVQLVYTLHLGGKEYFFGQDNYGVPKDELLCNRFINNNVSSISFMWRSECPINH